VKLLTDILASSSSGDVKGLEYPLKASVTGRKGIFLPIFFKRLGNE
jgi:hypothetical protein